MKPWKIVTIGLWALAAACVAAFAVVRVTTPETAAPVVAVAAEPPRDDAELPVLFETPKFALTDQDGQPFGSDDLKGKVWVGFIFLTQCPSGACPVMVGKLKSLQDALPDERVNFVSFTIDPERDTPEVLKKYAERTSNGVVSPRWHLLTGETRQRMFELARGMNLTFDDENQHSTYFLLVDATGTVRGLYGNSDAEAMNQLRDDAQKLLADGGK